MRSNYSFQRTRYALLNSGVEDRAFPEAAARDRRHRVGRSPLSAGRQGTARCGH